MILQGIAGSKGIVSGRVYIYQQSIEIDSTNIRDDQIPDELDKVDKAAEQTRHQIHRIKEIALRDFGEDKAAIFDAHLMILEDPMLVPEIKETIKNDRVQAGYAVKKSTGKLVEMFSDIEDEYLKERIADIKDVGNRLIRNILGAADEGLEAIGRDVLVVAHDLTPSDTATMDKKHIKGFATEIGGKTSHTAIMARSLGIPAVLGLGDIMKKIKNDDYIILDGIEGVVIVNPDKGQIEEYERKARKHKEDMDSLKAIAELPAVTTDGRSIEISANIGSPEDVQSAISYGADGVGLYRTEFLYMNRESLPSEDEQFEAYKTVAERFKDKPIIIRTLDIGGDKKLPYLELPDEMNPFLGWRAIRICLERKDLFKTQLRAILRAGAYGNVLMMYPMISAVDEVIEANKVLDEAKSELKAEGIAFNESIKTGVMIEIPSAALTADIIIKEVDFFSIGTNDLCQYTLAVDRMNEKISKLYQPFHPGILRLIKTVIDASHKEGKFTGMCGELAGDPAAAVILLGLGLDEFSMSASSMPQIKKIIRSVSYEKAKAYAQNALNMRYSSEIHEYALKIIDELNDV